MEKQAHVYYSGRVQGVGFRFTAQGLAQRMRIKGWVKNLDDGRVEIVAEAEEDALKGFLEEIGRDFSRYIQDVALAWNEATGVFKDFSIEF